MRVCGELVFVLALAGLSAAAWAQGLPPGSYQRSCSAVRVQGAILSASCRRDDGRFVLSTIDISRCPGDIENRNGRLKCGGGFAAPMPPPTRPPAYAGPGYPAPGYPTPGYPPPGYPPPGYPPAGGYGPRYSGRDFHEYCDGLRHQAHELYEQLARTPYGEYREHLEHRLHEVNYQRQQCPRY